jgi:protease-4
VLIIVLLLLIPGIAVIGLIGLGLMANTAGGMAGADPLIIEQVVERGEGSKKVVIVAVNGIIQSGPVNIGASTEMMKRILKQIADDENVAAVVLDMNTPGGEVTATDEIYHEIQKIRKDRNIPFVTCMRSVAASGGYYLAAGTDHIVANRLTLTGSIGVLMGGYNYHGLFEKIGVKSELYTSGKQKDMLNMARPRGAAESAYIQAMVDEMFHEFATIVSEGRNLSIDEISGFEAAIFSGKEAKEVGLVDQLGYLEDAIAKAAELADLEDPPVIRYGRRPSFTEMLFMKSQPANPLGQLGVATQVKPGIPYFLTPMAY